MFASCRRQQLILLTSLSLRGTFALQLPWRPIPHPRQFSSDTNRSMAPKKFYAVAVGRITGIFNTWDECQKQVKGFPKAKFKSFKTKEDAESFINNNNETDDSKKREPEEGKATVNNPYNTTNSRKRPKRKECDKTLRIQITFDGGSRGNPGIAGAGAAVTLTEPSVSPEQAKTAFRRVLHIRDYLGNRFTNNEAEYQGILRAMMFAKMEALQYCPPPLSLKTNLIVQGDSHLIISQLNGEYECKSDKLIGRYKQVLALIKDLDNMGECNKHLEHVYRKDNTVADGLANEAMDAQRSWYTTSDDDHETQHALASKTRDV